MTKGKTEKYIEKKLSHGKMHVSLLDPDPRKMTIDQLSELARRVKKAGSDLIIVGGSTLSIPLRDKISYMMTGILPEQKNPFLDEAVKEMKKIGLPIVLFPGGINGITKEADAILFMSLLNSRDPKWISRIQAHASLQIKKMKLEAIPMAYLIIEPGMKVGKVGKASPVPRHDSRKAASYALAAQYFGFRYVYLEAGSGAPLPVPSEMIKAVRDETNIRLIAGGGIRTPDAAMTACKAGADIIVTGTILEEDPSRIEGIIRAVHSAKNR